MINFCLFQKKDLEFISADESDSSAFFERQEERDVESGAPSQQFVPKFLPSTATAECSS